MRLKGTCYLGMMMNPCNLTIQAAGRKDNHKLSPGHPEIHNDFQTSRNLSLTNINKKPKQTADVLFSHFNRIPELHISEYINVQERQ